MQFSMYKIITQCLHISKRSLNYVIGNSEIQIHFWPLMSSSPVQKFLKQPHMRDDLIWGYVNECGSHNNWQQQRFLNTQQPKTQNQINEIWLQLAVLLYVTLYDFTAALVLKTHVRTNLCMPSCHTTQRTQPEIPQLRFKNIVY